MADIPSDMDTLMLAVLEGISYGECRNVFVVEHGHNSLLLHAPIRIILNRIASQRLTPMDDRSGAELGVLVANK